MSKKYELTNDKAIIIAIQEDMMQPLKVSYENGIANWRKKEDVLFVKSNAINWEAI